MTFCSMNSGDSTMANNAFRTAPRALRSWRGTSRLRTTTANDASTTRKSASASTGVSEKAKRRVALPLTASPP